MIFRYLLLILFILLVIWATRAMRGSAGSSKEDAAKPQVKRSAAAGEAADADKLMLSCAHCGLLLPRDEALPGKGGVFCSAAHRALVEARDDDA